MHQSTDTKRRNATAKTTCLVHSAQNISEGWKIEGGTMRQMTNQCGTLRRNWSENAPYSKHATWMLRHQSDCTKPFATHYLDNTYGLGSHLILWGQAMCNAIEQGFRMHSAVKLDSESPWWIWLDQEYCDSYQDNPMKCYFPSPEQQSPDCDMKVTNITVKDPRAYRCELVQHNMTIRQRDDYRASATEYLFSKMNPLVMQEAQRQMGIVFGDLPNAMSPLGLITVHIRWGDKFWEMDLPKIDEYIDAVHTLLKQNPRLGANGVHIYLATEDPTAYEHFVKFAPKNWKVYPDITLQEINSFRPVKGNRASHATRNTRGRAGLVALGSLLVAMEANAFVLTTKSNWSTLMNHLRKTIVNRQCGNCTTAIDLRPDVW